MKIALVHDYLQVYGGAERVLEALHEIWPEAPVYTAFAVKSKVKSQKSKVNLMDRFRAWEIRTTWAQRIPFIKKLHSPLRFLAPLFWESLDFRHYDVVISSSSPYFGKGIVTKPSTLHISYCHTPPRFLYGYTTAVDWQKHWWTRLYGTIVNYYLRQYDYLAAQRVDYFVANSLETASRIRKFYRRESTVIYPPVAMPRRKVGVYPRPLAGNDAASSTGEKANLGSHKNEQKEHLQLRGEDKPRPYALVVSRLARAKGVELAVKAANKLKLSLVVVGTGQEEKKLKQIAGPTVKFVGEVSDEELGQYYRFCKALIFPAIEEDFGIVPVEAMSFGKPVIAFRSGGVMETVVEGQSGLFFDQPTVASLVKVWQRFNDLNNQSKFEAKKIIKQAQKFSKKRFKREIKEFVEGKYEKMTNS